MRGLSEFYRELDAIPAAARHALADKMGRIGRDILAAQHQAVPKATGTLDGGLSLQLLTERLKLKVGLLVGSREGYRFNGRTRKALAGGPFYGRFVEFGRRAQTVLVTRRLKVVRRLGNNRKGNIRRTVYDGKPYTMRVRAMAPRPFVRQPDVQQIAERDLSTFWVDVLARTGAA